MTSRGWATHANMASTGWASASGRSTSGEIAIWFRSSLLGGGISMVWRTGESAGVTAFRGIHPWPRRHWLCRIPTRCGIRLKEFLVSCRRVSVRITTWRGANPRPSGHRPYMTRAHGRIRLTESLVLHGAPARLGSSDRHRLNQFRVRARGIGSNRAGWRGRRSLGRYHTMSVNVTILLRVINDRRIRMPRADVSPSRRGRCRARSAHANWSMPGFPPETLNLRGR